MKRDAKEMQKRCKSVYIYIYIYAVTKPKSRVNTIFVKCHVSVSNPWLVNVHHLPMVCLCHTGRSREPADDVSEVCRWPSACPDQTTMPASPPVTLECGLTGWFTVIVVRILST